MSSDDNDPAEAGSSSASSSGDEASPANLDGEMPFFALSEHAHRRRLIGVPEDMRRAMEAVETAAAAAAEQPGTSAENSDARVAVQVPRGASVTITVTITVNTSSDGEPSSAALADQAAGRV